jgi:glycosyltransferase involved in cell wall biosynthesis
MRVAVINTHPIQHFAPLWREIAKSKEVELRVLYCTDWGVSEYRDPDFGIAFKWDVDLLSAYDSEFLPIRARPKTLSFWETDNPKVWDALSAFSADVVVIFGYSHMTNLRAIAWAKLHRARVLVFCDSELRHRRPFWVRLAKQFAVRLFLAQADAVLPVGNCNAAYYRHYGVPRGSMFWCAYPVDGARLLAAAGDVRATRAAIRSKLGIDQEEFVFACVAKYLPRKRQQDVVRAWLALPEAARNKSWVLLVGEGPLRRELEELVAATGARVILTGFVNQSEISRYFAASDAIVVPSEVDAHPLVVTESLFFGLPVVASDRIGCIGPKDTIRDGENALVYRCGDVGGLRDAMVFLIGDAEICLRFGKKSREIAVSQDVTVTSLKFIEAFKEVGTLQEPRFIDQVLRLIPGYQEASNAHEQWL